MARKKRSADSGGGGAGWMNTYADMVTLLLCFFVLLFAFSSLDAKKFDMLSQSLRNAIMPGGMNPPDVPRGVPAVVPADPGDVQREIDSDQAEQSRQVLAMLTVSNEEIKEQVDKAIKEMGMGAEIETWVDERGVAVSISEQLLFAEGSAVIHSEAKRILYKLGSILERLPNMLSIEGHTDPERPINSIYRDNWGLSSARAAAVTSYLNDTIGVKESRLRAVGFGSWSAKVPNDSPANMRLNRRVDIIIMAEHSVR